MNNNNGKQWHNGPNEEKTIKYRKSVRIKAQNANILFANQNNFSLASDSNRKTMPMNNECH